MEVNRLFSQFLPVLEELTKNEDTRKLLLSTMWNVWFEQKDVCEMYKLVLSRSGFRSRCNFRSRCSRSGFRSRRSLLMVTSSIVALLRSHVNLRSSSTLSRSGTLGRSSTLSRSRSSIYSSSSLSSAARSLTILFSLHSSREASEPQWSLCII